MEDHLFCDGVALAVGVDHADKVVLRVADAKLAAHAVEEEAAVFADPELVAVAVFVEGVQTPFVVVHLASGGLSQVFGVHVALSLPGALVHDELSEGQQIAAGAQDGGVAPGVTAGCLQAVGLFRKADMAEDTLPQKFHKGHAGDALHHGAHHV